MRKRLFLPLLAIAGVLAVAGALLAQGPAQRPQPPTSSTPASNAPGLFAPNPFGVAPAPPAHVFPPLQPMPLPKPSEVQPGPVLAAPPGSLCSVPLLEMTPPKATDPAIQLRSDPKFGTMPQATVPAPPALRRACRL